MAVKDKQELESAARFYWMAEGHKPGGVIREVDYSTQTGGVDPLFAGIKIVDCDTHFTEAPDLFTSRAPARLKDKVPRINRDADGIDRWYVGERNFGTVGGNVIRKDKNKVLGRLTIPTFDESEPGTYLIKPRVQMMDDMGVWAQICFQNGGVTQPGSLMTLGDNELALTILQIYNDASMDYQEESGQRVFTMAHLPYWDRDAMVAEARRCIDSGLKGFVFPDKPEQFGIARYADDWWAPVLEMLNDTGTPITFHINAAIDPSTCIWEGFPFQEKLTIYPVMHSLACSATIGNWMVSGLLDRYPKLKIGLIEAGTGWVPFVLDMFTHQFKEMLPDHASKLDKMPWDYWRDHFWTTFWFEKDRLDTDCAALGYDKVLFETDFPHPTSIYPDVQKFIVERVGDMPFENRKKLLQDNAVTLFNLPI